ncbi:MAG: hypothetical protein ACXWB9_05975, partial [Flavisolibacter sp.]
SKTISMISISVAKGSITSPPIEKAKTNIPLFLQQMKTIIEASKSGLSSHKVKLVYTTEDGDKNYTSDLLLEGYTTYIIERDDAILFHAASDDITLSGINILKLLDKTQREQAGILGYTTHYTAINPTSSLRAEGVTKFSKPGTLSLKVYKNLFDKGYRIEIEDFFME